MYARWNEEYYQHALAEWEWRQCQAERINKEDQAEDETVSSSPKKC